MPKAACYICHKRLTVATVLTNHCRCGQLFCNVHIPSNVHLCTYDYKQMEQNRLEHSLVRCVASKVDKF